jgi:hypothetical protein
MFGLVLASMYAALNISSRSKVPPVSLEARLENLGRSMRTSANLVRQIEFELGVRERRVRELTQKANDAEAAAALSQAEREAVANMIREEMLTNAEPKKRSAATLGQRGVLSRWHPGQRGCPAPGPSACLTALRVHSRPANGLGQDA